MTSEHLLFSSQIMPGQINMIITDYKYNNVIMTIGFSCSLSQACNFSSLTNKKRDPYYLNRTKSFKDVDYDKKPLNDHQKAVNKS